MSAKEILELHCLGVICEKEDIEATMEALHTMIMDLSKKRLRDGNVLPNIGNMPIDIYNSAIKDCASLFGKE